MIIIAVLTAWDLGYNTYYSVHLKENGASLFGIILWFLLKFAALLTFIYIAFRREDTKARKINFFTYTIS